MLQSCFVNEVHLNAEVTLGMSCVRISALELQDNDNFRLTLSRVFTILNLTQFLRAMQTGISY